MNETGSFVKNIWRRHENCFCAFCRTPRRIARKKHINFANVLAAVPVAILLMWAFWRDADPRVMVVYVVLLAFAETFVQMRWRLSVACTSCGFDPVVYLKDPALAVSKVKRRLDQRKQDPAMLLARPLNLPHLSSSRAGELAAEMTTAPVPAGKSKGGLVSRSV